MLKFNHNNLVKSNVSSTKELQKAFLAHYAHVPAFQFKEHLQYTLKMQNEINSVVSSFTDIVLLGTGGSSLGAQVLCGFLKFEQNIKIHFFDNIDPLTFQSFWQRVKFETTLFLVISKSGETPETLTQAIIAAEKLERAVGAGHVKKHMVVLTEEKDSSLLRLTRRYGCVCVKHDAGIGGRFSVLSVVGLLPAALMNIDVAKIIQGAEAVYHAVCSDVAYQPLVESTLLVYETMQQHGLTEYVLMPYIDKLEPLGRWFRQLWAESLGKNGKGSTPINAMGTVDQHSQLQLYLDGPGNKFFTIIKHPLNIPGDTVSQDLANAIGFDFMSGKTMAELMNAEQCATIDVLIQKQCAVRVLNIPDVSLESLGGLLVFFMIETILTASLMGVECFNQPAVEQGKKLTKQILAQNQI
jgi:glucose-6-phosphate isomerase